MAHDLLEALLVEEAENLALRRRGSRVREVLPSSRLQGVMERRACLWVEDNCIYRKHQKLLSLLEGDLETEAY
jgi:hypothetical protein